MAQDGIYSLVFNMKFFLEQRATCMAGLRHWMNTVIIYTFNEETNSLPPLVIVGTAKDLVPNHETHAEISAALYDALHNSKAWNFLVINKQDGLTALNFFPVDNVQGRADPTIQHLLGVLETQIVDLPHVKRQVPLSWLASLDLLISKKKSYFTYDEVKDISITCGIPDYEVDKFLQSMHQVRNHGTMFKYFIYNVFKYLFFKFKMASLIWFADENLRDVIIMDPVDFFIIPASVVIFDSSLHENDIHKWCRQQMSDEYNFMLNNGVAVDSLIRKLLSEHADKAENVVRLMVRFGLLVPVEKRLQGSTAADDNTTFIPNVKRFIVPAYLPKLLPSDRISGGHVLRDCFTMSFVLN